MPRNPDDRLEVVDRCDWVSGIGLAGMTEQRGKFGAILQMRAKAGCRAEMLQLLTNYAGTLDGEPGTLLFAVAADPDDDEAVFVWEEFADGPAVQAHFEHDFFRALQMELAELLDGPASAQPMVPVVRRVNPGVTAE